MMSQQRLSIVVPQRRSYFTNQLAHQILRVDDDLHSLVVRDDEPSATTLQGSLAALASFYRRQEAVFGGTGRGPSAASGATKDSGA